MPSFNEPDWKLIDTAKRTMRILSKVIGDKDPKAVVKDDAALLGDKTLEEALADPELAAKIRDKLTPDLPQLNAEQEALAIVQLGPAIFGQLLEAGDE